ncbi:arginine/serine-rich coiled-coil protein 2-like [Aethina tumida]|uniref:arginine/serine-rich coiled-coil protein 2-like n=1 Tax=Aethina tumida TaxID=116153 RepID=UPI00214875AC|nr:arginine/serine-rich coiled-coil protein 2-like [Aethina tumida]
MGSSQNPEPDKNKQHDVKSAKEILKKYLQFQNEILEANPDMDEETAMDFAARIWEDMNINIMKPQAEESNENKVDNQKVNEKVDYQDQDEDDQGEPSDKHRMRSKSKSKSRSRSRSSRGKSKSRSKSKKQKRRRKSKK